MLRDGENCGGAKQVPWLFHDGTRTNAAGGDEAEAFACMARVGTTGCSFEMPLAAVRTALAGQAANEGFLRDDAMLAVIIITDEDDCSVADPGFLDPEAPLGFATSFRCFAHGVRCSEGPSDPAEPGPRAGCEPAGDYLEDPARLAGFLRELKGNQASFLAVISGPSAPVAVGKNSAGHPLLLASCDSSFGSAAPGVRLEAAARAAGDDGLLLNLCDGDFGPALAAIGERIGAKLDARCLSTVPADLDPAAPGLQAECAVVTDDVPAADWSLVEDASCPSGWSLLVAGQHVELSCVTSPPAG
jgi:hypothetical protein